MSRLFLRLFGWFVAANLVTLLITALVAERVSTAVQLGRQPDWSVVAEATQLRYQVGGLEGLRRWQTRMRHRGIDVHLLDAQGRWIGPALDARYRPHLDALLAQDEVVLRADRHTWLAGVALEGAERPLHLIAARRVRAPPGSPFPVGLQLTIAALVIAGVGAWLTRGLTRPIHAVQRAARAVAEGRLDARVGAPHVAASDELGQLARDFDAMAERIQTLVEHTRGLLHDVSHELRSPLARLQLALEIAKRGGDDGPQSPLSRAQREVQRLDRVIGEVLALARLETGMPDAGHQPLQLDELLHERLAECTERITEKQLALELSIDPATVRGDRLLLGRALDNLLDNAIKFSPTGGRLAIACDTQASSVTLGIADGGPGIDPADAERLLRPFYRGRNAALADGQGMGLAIVDRIARLHGGQVSLQPVAGGGTRASLLLPLHAAGPARNGLRLQPDAAPRI